MKKKKSNLWCASLTQCSPVPGVTLFDQSLPLRKYNRARRKRRSNEKWTRRSFREQVQGSNDVIPRWKTKKEVLFDNYYCSCCFPKVRRLFFWFVSQHFLSFCSITVSEITSCEELCVFFLWRKLVKRGKSGTMRRLCTCTVYVLRNLSEPSPGSPFQ